MDIHAHGGNRIWAMRETGDWLANVSRRALPSADRLIALHEAFENQLPKIASAFQLDPAAIPYVDFERIVVERLLRPSPVVE